MTLPPIDAASAEDAAVFATKFMRSEAAIEIWQGAPARVPRRKAPPKQGLSGC